jgi:O-antigen/teichoic acid export membrane protein
LGFIFATLTDVGLNQYVTKKLATEPAKLKEVFSNIFSLKIIMLIVYPMFMSAIGYVFNYKTHEIYLLAILSFTQALIQLIFFFRANFQANQYFKIDSIASILDKFILIIIVVIMLSQRITLDLFVYACFASIFVTALIFYIVSIKLFDFIAPKLEPKKLKELIKLSIPFAIITILYSINDKVVNVMIERISNETHKNDAGFYAAAARFLNAIMMYLWTVLPILFAKFAYHHSSNKEKQKLLNFGQIISSIPMVFIAVFIFFYGETLFFQQNENLDPKLIRTPEEINTIVTILKILMFSAIIHGMFAIYSTLLTSTGYENKVSKMIIGSILINVIGNFIFIPLSGPIASAWITLAGTIFLSIFYVYYTHIKLEVNVPYNIILRLSIVFILFAGVFYLLSMTNLQWYLVSMMAGASLLIFSYIAGLLDLMLGKD